MNREFTNVSLFVFFFINSKVLYSIVACTSQSRSVTPSKSRHVPQTIKEILSANSDGRGIIGKFTDTQEILPMSYPPSTMTISPETSALLEFAKDYFQISDNHFNSLKDRLLFTCYPGVCYRLNTNNVGFYSRLSDIPRATLHCRLVIYRFFNF
jgi:hypothetical protein